MLNLKDKIKEMSAERERQLTNQTINKKRCRRKSRSVIIQQLHQKLMKLDKQNERKSTDFQLKRKQWKFLQYNIQRS